MSPGRLPVLSLFPGVSVSIRNKDFEDFKGEGYGLLNQFIALFSI